MGLSFHFSGSIANPASLPDLIEEVQDIAIANNWEYFVFERHFPENNFGKSNYNQKVYGICFTPPNCETVDICFLSNGRMSSVMHLRFFGKTEDQVESEYLYMLSVKTQYAGVETHQFIIQLFRYLHKKYFTDFALTDEGQYWETNDVAVLTANFKKYTDLVAGFSSSIDIYPMKPGEDIESYFLRLMKQINDLKKRGE